MAFEPDGGGVGVVCWRWWKEYVGGIHAVFATCRYICYNVQDIVRNNGHVCRLRSERVRSNVVLLFLTYNMIIANAFYFRATLKSQRGLQPLLLTWLHFLNVFPSRSRCAYAANKKHMGLSLTSSSNLLADKFTIYSY